MSVYIIRNVDSVAHTYAGMEIAASDQYQIELSELYRWSSDTNLLTDILSNIVVVNDGTTDITDVNRAIDYLKNIAKLDSDGYPVIRSRAFNSTDGFLFRGIGISGVASAGTAHNIDYGVSAERYINGCHLILDGQSINDSLKFQIVDIDNILGYGAGAVLNTFADSWQIVTDTQNQGVFKIEYPARIYAGLYIRIRYTSTGSNDVTVKCNLFLHEST